MYVCVLLGIEPKHLCMLGKQSTTVLHPQTLYTILYTVEI